MTRPGLATRAARKQRDARLQIAEKSDEPCCRCGGPIDYRMAWTRPPNPGYPTLDHLEPVMVGGPELTTMDRIAPAHWRCNTRHGAKMQAATAGPGMAQRLKGRPAPPTPDQPARADLVRQLSGPPCAGKSTYVAEHRAPDDAVLDDLALAEQYGGRDRIPNDAWRSWYANKTRRARTWTGPGTLWIIKGDPTPVAPGVNVHLIDPGEAECHARADRDGRPATTHDWIRRWYAKTKSRSFLPAALATPRPPVERSLPASEPFPVVRADFPDWAAEWLQECPVPPRIVTPPLPQAVGSHGPAMAAWAAENMGIVLRPWQMLAAVLGLAHDADGRFTNRRVGVSVPRQVGKSWLLRALAGWRIHAADLFGEPQTVLHVSHSLNTTEEVFVPALLWAKGRGLKVREANGQMRIEAPDGSRWVPRSTQTGYGFSLSLALVDEAWSVAPRRVDSTYAPTLSERAGGQVWMFSTASQEASALFPAFRSAGRDGWCLVEWSAPDGSPGRLEAATPVPMTVERRELCDDELASDPVTFRFERLNVWPSVGESGPPGLLDADAWAGLVGSPGVVAGVGVEAERGEPPVVASVSRDRDGRLVVSVVRCGSVAEAVARCEGLGLPPRVGKSLLADPGWLPLQPVGMAGTARDLAGEFRRLALDGLLLHDGGGLLGSVVAAWSGGPSDRADALKAAVWAVRAARELVEPPAVF